MEVPEVDLHGYTVPNALLEVENTLSQYEDTQNETVCFIVGKGLHSEGNRPRLKPAVSNWLQQNNYNLERHPNEGRLYVKTRRTRRQKQAAESCRVQIEPDEPQTSSNYSRALRHNHKAWRINTNNHARGNNYNDDESGTPFLSTHTHTDRPTAPCIPTVCKVILAVAVAAAVVGGGILAWVLNK